MQLIGLRQQLDILQGIAAAKPMDGALTPVEPAVLDILLNQALYLNPGIAADLLEEISHEPFLGFAELAVVEAE